MDDSLKKMIAKIMNDYKASTQPLADQLRELQEKMNSLAVRIEIPKAQVEISAFLEAQRTYSEHISRTYSFSKPFADAISKFMSNFNMTIAATAQSMKLYSGIANALIDSISKYAESQQSATVAIPVPDSNGVETEADLKIIVMGLRDQVTSLETKVLDRMDDIHTEVEEMREETGVMDKQNKAMTIIFFLISMVYSILSSNGTDESVSHDSDKKQLQSDLYQIIEMHCSGPDGQPKILSMEADGGTKS